MPAQVGHAGRQCLHVRLLEPVLGNAAVHLEGPHGGHHDDGGRRHIRDAGLDVHELFGPEICAEACFRHHDVSKPAGGLGGDERVAAVGDVGERAAVDQCRGPGDGLHQVGLDGVLQQQGQCALHAQVRHGDRGPVIGVAEGDAAQPFAQICHARSEAEHRHDLRRHGDVEPVLARDALGGAAEPDHHFPEGAVIHVQYPLERHPARVDVQLVALVDVVVHQGHEGVVGRRHGVEVAGEVQVDLVHGHHLGVPAARGPSLHAQDRARATAHAARSSPCGRPLPANRRAPPSWWIFPRPPAWATSPRPEPPSRQGGPADSFAGSIFAL